MRIMHVGGGVRGQEEAWCSGKSKEGEGRVNGEG